MKKVGHTSEFFLGFIDELEKQIIIKKKLLKWANKKQNNLNLYNAAFKKQIKKNTCRISLSKSSYRAKHTEVANIRSFFSPFYPPKKPKNQNFKK